MYDALKRDAYDVEEKACINVRLLASRQDRLVLSMNFITARGREIVLGLHGGAKLRKKAIPEIF